MCFSVICNECKIRLADHKCISECFNNRAFMYVICTKCYPIAKFVGMSYSSGLVDDNYLLGTINHNGKVVLANKSVTKQCYPYILTDIEYNFKLMSALVSAKTVFEYIKRNTFNVQWLNPSQA